MKRFLIAGVVALALLAGTAARAEAHGGFGVGVGFGIGVNFSWSAWSGCPTGCGNGSPAPVEFIIPIQPHGDYIPMRPL